MTPFEIVLLIAGIAIFGSLFSGVILMFSTRDFLTRAIVSDLVFYGMLCGYLVWSIIHPNSISYEVALIGALAAGVLPTLSMARMITRGRR